MSAQRTGGSHCDSAVALVSAVLEIDKHGVGRPLRTASATRLPRAQRPLSDAEIERLLGATVVTEAREATVVAPDGTPQRVAVAVGRKPWQRGRR
jgi:hypothetical protein